MRVHRRGIEMAVLAAITLAGRAALAQEEEPAPEPQPEAPVEAPAPPPPPSPSPIEEAAPEPAPPPPPPPPARKVVRFGSAGVVMVSTNAAIGVSGATYDNSKAESFGASFSPGLDTFIVPRVSLGLDLGAGYSDSRGYAADSSLIRTEVTSLSAGVRIGFDLPLGRFFSFYPRVTGGLQRWQSKSTVVEARSSAGPTSATGIPASSGEGPWITVFAPLLYHPAPHFFGGIGPTLSHSFARVQGGPEIGGESTTFGGQIVFGVWWGGQADAEATPDEARVVREPVFGETGQVVFTGEFDVHAGHVTYGGTSSSGTALTLAPGFDTFVLDHVSLGLEARFTYYQAVGQRPDGTRAETTRSGGGLAPRIGVDIPIVRHLSFYPRASLAFGGQSFETRAGKDGYEYSETNTTASLFAPLLVHPTAHAFIGFGPYVGRDLTRKIEGGVADNPGTTYGASLLVGGWL